MTICPCCGQPLYAPRVPIEALEAAPLATVPRTIVNTLARAYPRAVSPDFLIERIYSGSREPEYAQSALRVQMCHLRLRLRDFGWTVSKGRRGRGNQSRYKLEPLPNEQLTPPKRCSEPANRENPGSAIVDPETASNSTGQITNRKALP